MVVFDRAGAPMAIANDAELGAAVAQASSLVQEIHDYCGRQLRMDAKINFPRGMIGTANSYRERCPAYLTRDQISSCAYGFMFLDVLWWLASRTDIASVGKQMTLKSAIVTLGTILEVSLHVPILPQSRVLSAKNGAGVNPRLEKSKEEGWITEEQCATLKQLWLHRNNVHIKILAQSELDLYQPQHVNEPYAALLVLMARLKEWNGGV
jgi:hypothetical protein